MKEETGLEITNIKQGIVTNDIIKEEDRHFVSIIMVADYIDGEPQLMEPDKCEGWQWFTMDDLPEKLCHPNECGFRQVGFDPFKV